MLSNQVLNKIMTDIHKIMGVDCSVWSMEGRFLCGTCADCSKVQQRLMGALEKVVLRGERVTKQYGFFLVRDEGQPMYVLALQGGLENGRMMGELCVSQFEHLLQAYKTRIDKNRFYQNLLLDNLLIVDIFNQARKVGVEAEARRAVFVIEPKQESDNLILETIKGLYVTGSRDFVTAVDENHVIYIKGLDRMEDYPDLEHTANALADTINTEVMVGVRVAYGTIVENIQEVSKSYKEAMMALDVGRIFYEGKEVLAYNELGIGRLIHQLPISLCEMFMKEVFEDNVLEQLDEETLGTVNLFFENSLNISETARKLYVHRNTLVYRLEKIQRITGLDVRVFDEALAFKIALMVSKHMKAMQQ